jgi:PAS domain S-box-containing protein
MATLGLQRVAPQRPLSLVFFFAAVAVSAGSGGLWYGVLATLLSALVYDYFFLYPIHSLTVAGSDMPLLVLFIVVAALINGLGERLRAGTRAADARFHDLVQGVDGIVWEANPATGQFTFVSRRAEDLLGYPVSEWLTDPAFRTRLVHPEDLVTVGAACRDALTRGGDHTFEYRARTVTGQEVWLRETVHGVRGEGSQTQRLMGLCVDVTERRLANRHLQHLSRQLVQVQEAERRGIARELHDEVGQVLTGLKLSLETAVRRPPEEAGDHMNRALSLVNELMAHVSDLSLDLRPAMLDDLGLLPALLWHFDRYSRQTGVRVDFEHTGAERRFPQEVETAAYRVVQEALTNVARHAGVNHVTVRLWAVHDLLGAQILDRGRGFAPDAVRASAETAGLTGMTERVSLVGGRLTIESAPGSGACLTAEIPLTPSAAEEMEAPSEQHDPHTGR